jgi:hypothetical protein
MISTSISLIIKLKPLRILAPCRVRGLRSDESQKVADPLHRGHLAGVMNVGVQLPLKEGAVSGRGWKCSGKCRCSQQRTVCNLGEVGGGGRGRRWGEVEADAQPA